VDSTGFLSGFYKGDDEEAGLVNRIDEELPLIDYPAIPVGTDPESGKPMLVRIGKASAFVQRGEAEDAERVTLPRDLLIDDLTVERVNELLDMKMKGDAPIAKDPDTGLDVFVKVGPYGPYVQLGEAVKGGDKPKRSSLPRGVEPKDVTPELALKLVSLPRILGTDPETGTDVSAGLGRYGPYVERDRTFRSIDSFERIFEIGLPEAIELINTKKARGKVALKEVGPHPETGAMIQAFEGRYGPYVSDGTVNATIPKTQDPMAVTVEQSVELLKAAAERKKNKPRRGRKTAKR